MQQIRLFVDLYLLKLSWESQYQAQDQRFLTMLIILFVQRFQVPFIQLQLVLLLNIGTELVKVARHVTQIVMLVLMILKWNYNHIAQDVMPDILFIQWLNVILIILLLRCV